MIGRLGQSAADLDLPALQISNGVLSMPSFMTKKVRLLAKAEDGDQVFAVQASEIGKVADAGFEEIVELASHQMAVET